MKSSFFSGNPFSLSSREQSLAVVLNPSDTRPLQLNWTLPDDLYSRAHDSVVGWFFESYQAPAGWILTLQVALMNLDFCLPATINLSPSDPCVADFFRLLDEAETIPLTLRNEQGTSSTVHELLMTAERRQRYADMWRTAIAQGTPPPDKYQFELALSQKREHPNGPAGDRRIGQLLVEFGLITEEKLRDVLPLHQQEGEVSFGTWLVEKGYCPPPEMIMTLQRQKVFRLQGMKLGLHLIEAGVLTQERLQEALALQEQRYQPLGELLVERHFCTAKAVEDAFEKQQYERYSQLLQEFLTRSSASLAP